MSELKYLDKEGLQIFADKIKQFVLKYHADTPTYLFRKVETLPSSVVTEALFNEMRCYVYLVGPKPVNSHTGSAIENPSLSGLGNTDEPITSGIVRNIYEEYVLIDSTPTGSQTKIYTWENIGSTDIDLWGYLNKDNYVTNGTLNSDDSIVITFSTSDNKFHFKHKNQVTAGSSLSKTQETSFSKKGNDSKLAASFNQGYVNYDAQGHVTGTGTASTTLELNLDRGLDVSTGSIGHTNTYSGDTKIGVGVSNTKMEFGGSIPVPHIEVDMYGHLTDGSEDSYILPGLASGTGIDIKQTNDGNKQLYIINHSNSVTDATIGGTNATTSSANIVLNKDTDIVVPRFSYDTQGHITSGKNFTYKISVGVESDLKWSTTNTKLTHSNTITAGNAGESAAKTTAYGGTFSIPYISWDANGHLTTGTASKTITLPAAQEGEKGIARNTSTNKLGHTNSITAGSLGPTAGATLSHGGKFKVPKFTYDAYGHLTAAGTVEFTLPNKELPDLPTSPAGTYGKYSEYHPNQDPQETRIGFKFPIITVDKYGRVTAAKDSEEITHITHGTAAVYNSPSKTYTAGTEVEIICHSVFGV